MRKRRMEQELNHPRFVGVRFPILSWNFWTGRRRFWGVSQIRMPAETSGGKGNRASGRSGR